MLSENHIRELLAPFGLKLTQLQVDQIGVYLDLLMRWNEKINLTAVRKAQECVPRHFGESLYLSVHEQLNGRMLDVGSGAGFPGLALKIALPAVEVTLLEPGGKKRAFLKEVVRCCGLTGVEIRADRLERLPEESGKFESITIRAVGNNKTLVNLAASKLKENGKVYLWLSREQSKALREESHTLEWDLEIEVPMSRERIILIGQRG